VSFKDNRVDLITIATVGVTLRVPLSRDQSILRYTAPPPQLLRDNQYPEGPPNNRPEAT